MFRLELADLLRAAGYDVLRASEAHQATADDAVILQRACRDDRVLITHDKHFGDWAILPLQTHPGVIRLKVHPTTTANAAAVLLPFLAKHGHDELRSRLIILSPGVERWIKTAEP